MSNGAAALPESAPRAEALDALRGLAILAMLLSGQLPFDEHALPAWMYHAQVPPPDFRWNGALPGITWVDLVFPFFLFAMGAAFPLALRRRMERDPPWRWVMFVAERGFLLAFFALFVQAIRPYTLSAHPTPNTWLVALLGFAILFPILTRLPAHWPALLRFGIRITGWIGAFLFFVLVKYPDGSGFKNTRSDIIIIVLANMAVFGAVVWILTRQRLLLRLGVLGILLAIRLSNMPQGTPGWVNDLWKFSPLPWLYQLYYLQYLCIVIPGTIAGDLIADWTQPQAAIKSPPPAVSKSNGHWFAVLLLMVGFVLLELIGLKSRWLPGTTLLSFAFCGVGWWLLSRAATPIELLYRRLFGWAIYWIVLGLFFEPYEGGIRKDKATVSYYFITSGLAICVLIGFSILIDVFQRRRWVRLLVANGQNPMIAYAGINNLILPLLALLGANATLSAFVTTPWRGFGAGVAVTWLLALVVGLFTRCKIFWRT